MSGLQDGDPWAEGGSEDFGGTPCPGLPRIGARLTAASMEEFRNDRGEKFYQAALSYAQSLWQHGLPAQALLQLNKAWSADLEGGEEVLMRWRPPYLALVWMLRHAARDAFLGNPVRHFQHLATRMNEVRREPRVWRAWACFHLAEAVLPEQEHPRDWVQIAREKVRIPTSGEVAAGLETCGWEGEADEFRNALTAAE